MTDKEIATILTLITFEFEKTHNDPEITSTEIVINVYSDLLKTIERFKN